MQTNSNTNTVNILGNSQEKIDQLDQQIENTKKSTPTTVTINRVQDEWWSNTNAMTISSVVLIYSFLIVLVAGYLIKIGRNSESVLKIFGVILIITSAVFLVVAGYSDKQIAPVVGLLGTLAGYLLGKDTKGRNSKTSSLTRQPRKDTSS